MSTMVIPKLTAYAPAPIWMIGVLAAGLFLLDLSLPLGVAAGVPYLLVVLLSKDVPGRPSTVMIGIVCSGLTVAGYVVSPAGGEEWKVLTNRGLALFAIWTTAVLTIRWKENAVELRHRAENMQAIVDLIPHMIFVRDPGGRFLMVNETTTEVFGVSKKELLESQDGLTNENTCEEITRPQSDCKVFDQQPMQTEEEISIDVQGDQRWFRTTRVPFDIDGSSDIGVLTVAIDQTEQRQAQQTLVLTKHVFDASADHISVIGADYRYRRVNPAYEKVHGLPLEKIVGLHVADLFGEDVFQEVVKPKIDQCLAGEEITYEFWFTFKETGPRYMVVTYTPLQMNEDDIDGVIVVARDLTERKQAELGRAQLEHAMDHAMEGVGLHDEKGIFTYINPAEAAMYGYEPHELLGKSWKEQYDAEQIAQIEEEVFPLLKEHGEWKGQLTGRRKTGDLFDVEVSFTRLTQEDGSTKGLVCTCRDITERRRAEEALRKSELEYRLVTDNVPALIAKIDRNHCYQFVNRHYQERFGLTKEQCIGKPVSEILGAQPYQYMKPNMDRALAGSEVCFETRVSTKTEDLRWMRATYIPDATSNGQVDSFYALIEDIHAHKTLEQELRNSEKRYRSLVETAGSVIIGLTPDGRIIEWNQEAERLYGWSRTEVLDKNYVEWFVADSERDAVKADSTLR